MGAAFEYADRLAELTRRQQEIENELDLTKNQAPGRLEFEAEPNPALEGDPLATPITDQEE